METHSNDIEKVYNLLKREFSKHRVPVVELIEFQTNDPFKVLVTTILSARTKDQTTVKAASRLFEQINKVDDLFHLPIATIETLIYPVGFYREKARYLKELPTVINQKFEGTIPKTLNDLLKLPGVGRKTANLVLAVAFNIPAVCVDIHVHRIFNRLGYLATNTPLETELELRKFLPIKFWTTFNSYFVSFGQNLCFPINPRCTICPIHNFCDRIGVKTKFSRTNI